MRNYKIKIIRDRSFGAIVKEQRDLKNLSQVQVCSGITTTSTLSRIENDKTDLFTTIVDVIKKLKIEPNTVFYEYDDQLQLASFIDRLLSLVYYKSYYETFNLLNAIRDFFGTENEYLYQLFMEVVFKNLNVKFDTETYKNTLNKYMNENCVYLSIQSTIVILNSIDNYLKSDEYKSTLTFTPIEKHAFIKAVASLNYHSFNTGCKSFVYLLKLVYSIAKTLNYEYMAKDVYNRLFKIISNFSFSSELTEPEILPLTTNNDTVLFSLLPEVKAPEIKFGEPIKVTEAREE